MLIKCELFAYIGNKGSTKRKTLHGHKDYILGASFYRAILYIDPHFRFPRKENEPEVIYLKHVERSAQQQRREVEESSRYSAPSFLTPLRDLNIVEGEKVHFDAKVAPVGDPTMKVEWFCNGKAVAASKAYFIYFLKIIFVAS